jgi:hypothetical protein
MSKQAQDIVETNQTSPYPVNIRAQKNIPIERIIELRNKKLSPEEIGKILGCSGVNVLQRLKSLIYEVDLIEPFKKNRANIFAFHQNRIIHSISPADLEKAGLRDKVVAAGILYDKERLETGQSTSNIFYADLIKARQIVDREIQEAEVVDNMSDNEGK